jgi:uncharacterized protein (TIGR02271 family)
MIGQPVYDMDGKELGKLKEVEGQYAKIDVRMAPDYWVRMGSIRQGQGGMLQLAADAEHYDRPDGLDQYEDVETRTTTTTEARGAARPARDTTARDVDTDETIRLREERLRAGTAQEEAGEVELGKRVVERTETVDVPLREERVVIERHPVNERVEGGQITDSNETIEVDLMRERAVAEKETVVTEEVEVRKEAAERTERVSDTVRKEELIVEEHGDVNVTGGDRARATEREQMRRS